MKLVLSFCVTVIYIAINAFLIFVLASMLSSAFAVLL